MPRQEKSHLYWGKYKGINNLALVDLKVLQITYKNIKEPLETILKDPKES